MRDLEHGFAGCIEDGRKSRPRRSNLHGVNDKSLFGEGLQRTGVIAVVHPTLDSFNIARHATDCCETFFFNSGYFLDGCWFAEDGGRFRPGIYFAEIGDDSQPTGTVYFPDPAIGTMLHEYAHGAASWLFDDHAEDASELETGDATGTA